MLKRIWMISLLLLALPLAAETEGETGAEPPPLEERLGTIEKQLETLSFSIDRLTKKVDDVLWLERVGDVERIPR